MQTIHFWILSYCNFPCSILNQFFLQFLERRWWGGVSWTCGNNNFTKADVDFEQSLFLSFTSCASQSLTRLTKERKRNCSQSIRLMSTGGLQFQPQSIIKTIAPLWVVSICSIQKGNGSPVKIFCSNGQHITGVVGSNCYTWNPCLLFILEHILLGQCSATLPLLCENTLSDLLKAKTWVPLWHSLARMLYSSALFYVVYENNLAFQAVLLFCSGFNIRISMSNMLSTLQIILCTL